MQMFESSKKRASATLGSPAVPSALLALERQSANAGDGAGNSPQINLPLRRSDWLDYVSSLFFPNFHLHAFFDAERLRQPQGNRIARLEGPGPDFVGHRRSPVYTLRIYA